MRIMKKFISMFLIITGKTFVEAKYFAMYTVGEEGSGLDWQLGPTFRIPDQQCNGFFNLKEPKFLKKFCGEWFGRPIHPAALELTTRDEYAFPSYSTVDSQISAFTAWRAACSGEAVVSTRVKCPLMHQHHGQPPPHDRVMFAIGLPARQEILLLPPAPEYIKKPQIDWNSLNQFETSES